MHIYAKLFRSKAEVIGCVIASASVVVTVGVECVFRIVDDSSDTFIEETYKTYDEREYPPRHSEIGRFDPFRPAATRSFYVR